MKYKYRRSISEREHLLYINIVLLPTVLYGNNNEIALIQRKCMTYTDPRQRVQLPLLFILFFGRGGG